MKPLFTLFFMCLLFLTPFTGVSQVLEAGTINKSDISAWNVSDNQAYEGIYKFGYSEFESKLRVIVTDNILVAQIEEGSWGDIDNRLAWILHYTPLENVRIEDGYFYSDQHSGQFVQYNDHGKLKKGLKIDNPWSADEEGVYEVSSVNYPISNDYYGQYPEASYRLLTDKELQSLSKTQLQLMRNEIFARYGYIFRKGGKMEAHFKKQDWYKAHHQDVNSFLTIIEKKNIQRIRAVEQQK